MCVIQTGSCGWRSAAFLSESEMCGMLSVPSRNLLEFSAVARSATSTNFQIALRAQHRARSIDQTWRSRFGWTISQATSSKEIRDRSCFSVISGDHVILDYPTHTKFTCNLRRPGGTEPESRARYVETSRSSALFADTCGAVGALTFAPMRELILPPISRNERLPYVHRNTDPRWFPVPFTGP